jgi:ClpP class serine protease
VPDLGSIVFLLFFLLLLVPMASQRRLQMRRYRAIRALERRRASRVITLIHRQEAVSLLGIPLRRFIDVDDSEQVLRAIRLTPDSVPLDLVVHTPGGLVLASEQIARALHRHPARVTVIVPHYAMSGGTLLALAADEIVMDPNAVLGPVDPQLGQQPAASVLTVLEQKKPEHIDDQTLILADVSRKAIVQVARTVQDLLSERMSLEQATSLAEKLSTGTWTHDYPILSEEGKSLGLPISTEMPDEVYEFMRLFPQPVRARPAVEYVPMRYGSRQGGSLSPRQP